MSQTRVFSISAYSNCFSLFHYTHAWTHNFSIASIVKTLGYNTDLLIRFRFDQCVIKFELV